MEFGNLVLNIYKHANMVIVLRLCNALPKIDDNISLGSGK